MPGYRPSQVGYPDAPPMMNDESEVGVSRNAGEYWTILVRRRWPVVLTMFFCWAITWIASWLIPSSYKSEALILVEQQKVPEQYVVPNVTVSLQDRLQSMTQQILSRTRLQSTIDHFRLYQARTGLSKLTPTEDPVEQMRKDIQIEVVDSAARPGQLSAFRIAFSASSAALAQHVNSELTSLFIDENLRLQQQLSESTTAFLDSELGQARQKLEQQEGKVRAFKAAHFTDLPSQATTNVQILSGLQAQLQSIQRAEDAAKQQKTYLESLQQQYETVQASLGDESSSETSPQALDKELATLRRQLEDARSRLTEEHPDVSALKGKIARTEKLKQQMEADIAAQSHHEKSSAGLGLNAAAEVQRGYTTPMMQVQSQLKATQLEIENDEKRARDLESQISRYETRLTVTPQTEQQLADVSRGYEESKANYVSLLQKQNQSQLATSLEQRQQGAQFRILDPPSLPSRPSSPNRLVLSLAGLAGGSLLGLGLAALLELTSVLVRQEKDLEGIVAASVLVGIPHLNVPGEGLARTRRTRLEMGALAIMASLFVLGNLYSLYRSGI